MNKKVKYLGAAAAALLTVAPIAAPVFSSVASTTVSAATPATHTLTVGGSKVVNVNENVKDYKTNASFNVTTNFGEVTASAISTTSPLVKSSGPVVGDNEKFVAGGTYYQNGTVTIKGLVAGDMYVLGSETYTASPEGTIYNVPAQTTLKAQDPTLEGQPYFVYGGVQVYYGSIALKSNELAVTVKDGAASVDANLTSVTNALTSLKSVITAFKSSSDKTPTTWNVSAAEVKKQLADQGITVASNGSFAANNFFVTLTATNVLNGKTTTVKVPFTTSYSDTALPYFIAKTKLGSEKLLNGSTSQGFVVINKGTVFNPTDKKYVTAYASVDNDNQTQISLQAVSNNVNSNVPGDYVTTYSATNANGRTSTVSVKVRVRATEYNDDTINYTPGYGVNIWALSGANYVTFTGSRALHGSSVRTWDTKVVDGVEYTRIGQKDSNTWVQSRYLASNKGQATTGETALTAKATVVYNGKGGVALRDANGKITGKQYVKNNTSWKVFAKKTVNGKTMYRLGSQSQWILAQYVTVK